MNDLVNGSLFESHFDDLERRQAAQKGTALILSTPDPDAAAEGVALGAELNVPPSAVMGAPEMFRDRAQTLRATTALQSAPNLADWLGDPVNGALGKDDLENLTWFERNLGPGGRALGRGTRRLSASPDYFAAIESGTRSADIGKSFDDILTEEAERWGGGAAFDDLPASTRVTIMQVAQQRFNAIEGQGEDDRVEYIRRGADRLARAQEIMRVAQGIPMSETATRFRDGRLANSENTLMGTLGAFLDDPIGGAAFIAETAAETLPILAAAASATALTRSPSAGVLVMSGGSFMTENTTASLQFLQERGVDMSTPEAAALVLQDAELMAEAQKFGVERGLIIAMFDAVSGGLAGQALLENPAGDMVAQAIAQAALGSSGEAAAQMATEGQLDWREVVIEGLAELATVPIEVVGVGGRGMLDMLGRFSRSGESAKALSVIDEVVDASKVRQRSPDKFMEALEASNLDGQALYVSADGLQEYFQAKDTVLDDETLKAWGIDPADFAEKLVSGGDVSVPVENYAARIKDTDAAPWFHENAVFDPGEMSVAEASDFNDRVRELMAEEFERHSESVESDRMTRAADVQIYDDVFSQLRAAGRSPDVAQQEATVWASFWRAMGERYGEDALDLARSMGVAIRGPQTPEIARRRDRMDIMLNTLRSQGDRALAPRGAGILEFVRDQGGVRDRGGDVEALDVPKGVVAETAAEILARESQPSMVGADLAGRGRGLDDLGRAMIEAGYFPEYMGGANINPDGTVVDEAAIALEAISEAVAGRDRFIEGEGPDQDLTDLAAALSERAIDLSMSNDEIVAALQENADGQTYDQDGRLITDTPEFRAWFGESKVVDENGEPLVVYHGSDEANQSGGDFSFDVGRKGIRSVMFDQQEVMSSGVFFSADKADAEGYGSDVGAYYLSVQNPIRDPMSVPLSSRSSDAEKSEVAKIWDDMLYIFEPVVEKTIGPDGEYDGGWSVDTDGGVSIQQGYGDEALLRTLFEGGLIDWAWLDNPDVASRMKERGYDGARVYEPDDESGMSWFVVDPTQIKSVHNRGTFDANDPRILFQDQSDEFEAYREASDVLRDLEHDADISEILEAVREKTGKRNDLVSALSEVDGGLELTNRIGDRFAAVSRSQSVEGGWRITFFDENGFSGHSEAASKRDAVEGAIQAGFDVEAEGALRSAMKSRRFFQRVGQSPRGSIILPRGGLTEGETVINLFESADLSTFLHESGHFFLEAFTALATSPDAPQAMREDLAVIHKFLGVEDGAALQVEQHEKWARGFEAYLMEGKAPSLALASAFARFKAWLSRIYRAVRNLDVKLSPEVREVMDRMLATDEEIAAMRDDLAMRPLFTDAAPAGMSDADFATYQRMAQRSADQAEQALMKRTMEKVRRETFKWFKEEKASVRAEVEGRVNRMPVYRLTEMLANQRWIGDETRDVPNMQIDRDALIEMFGQGVIAELGRQRLGGKRAIYAKGGEDPGIVSESFGFGSTVEMVEALQNAGKRKDFIAGEVDRIMTERHGDPLNDGSIEEAAALAVHSEQQAAMVATEARTLAKRLGLPTRNIKSKEYRARARAMLGRMTVREASRSASFLQAERRAAKAAERAFARVARGGARAEAALSEAMQAKEQQIINHYLYQEARDFEARLQRAREKFRSFQKESVRKAVGLAYLDEATGEMVPGHIEQIDALLDRYDFRSRSQKQVRNAESLVAYVQRMTEEGREDELAIDPKILRDAERRHYSRLSVDEFSGLVDTIANIEHMGRRRAALVDAKRRRDLNEVAAVVSALVRDRFGAGKSEKQSNTARNFFNLLMRVDTIAIDIDKAEMGDFYDAIKRPIDEGSSVEQKLNAQSASEISALFDVYTPKEKRDFNTARVIPGANGQAWTKQQILSVALNTGNKENLQRVLDRRAHESVRLTGAQLEALLDTMDKRDWDFVQSIWDFVAKFQRESFDVAERMTGVRPKAVEAASVQTKFGTYRGGYYPIAYDPSKSKAAQLDAESALDQFLSAGRGNAAKVADGFTKSRAQNGGGRAVLYDFSVMMRHSVDAARLIALAEPVYNAQRILNHRAVVDAFREGGQANLLSNLNLFLRDIAGGPVYSSDPINSASRFMKNNFTLSRLAFNFKTVALQVTGLGQSAAVIGKLNLLRGFSEYRKNPARVRSEVLAKSSYMAERQSTFQKDVFDAANEARVSSPIASRWRAGTELIAKSGFAPMVKTQFYVVDLPTWLGAYEAEIRRNGGDEEKAIHFADRMVDRSQGGGFMADRNALERGTVSRNVRQSDFVRLWTTLGGYMTTKLNRTYVTAKLGARAIGQAEGPVEKAALAASMAADLTLLLVFEAALMGVAYSALTDDEEDEDVAAFVAKEVAAAALGGVPFVRESFGAFNGYGAGGVLSSALEIPADVWTQLAQGENDRAFRRAIADAVGFGTGLPTTQAIRVIEEVIAGEDGSIAEAAFGRNPLAK